uniref:CASPASE_P20 domain-containing protein n=1 Tax=Heterorhabditis bacteriophora TaxID=37862 RepID=A0A1I7X5P5_HETBA
MVSLTTNLADLPPLTTQLLSNCLTCGDLWLKIIDDDKNDIFYMSNDEVDRHARMSNPGEAILRAWGNRGQTVLSLLSRLQALSKHHGSTMDHAQLILSRKFSRILKVCGNFSRTTIVRISNFRVYSRARDKKQKGKPDKHHMTDANAPFLTNCTECRDEKYVHIIEMVGMDNTLPNPVQPIYGKVITDGYYTKSIMYFTTVASREEEPLVAADKVALIISNCLYQHLPELVTPHCDAETLAMSLQEKLFYSDIAAVFYFVGHGFEVNGQCYLLPVEAPADAHHPEHCLSMDWVLSIFRAYNPALNLLLLDVCRKFIPFIIVIYIIFLFYFEKPYIAEDKKVCDVQIPELRSTLTRPRSLYDPLVFDGHTISFDHHTIHWRLMHGNCVYKLAVYFIMYSIFELDYCDSLQFFLGTLITAFIASMILIISNNIIFVYVFSSVGDLLEDNTEDIDGERQLSQNALNHLAFLTFPGDLYASKEKVVTDDEEGVSLCVLLSNLQRSRGEVRCFVELKHNSDLESVVATSSVVLGHVLITRIEMLK